MPKVTMIGAGSAVFARTVMTDILAVDGLDTGTFALVDIDPERLELARQIAERLVDLSGKRWTVEASTDRGEVLAGSNYIVNSIEVAGLQNVRADYDIPLRYGVDQCIGDTIGPGGIFKALRTGPAWLDIVADVTRLAPEALILNYTNPMSILTLAAARSSGLPVIGLCHSVQGTSRLLADYLQVPYEELDWKCAGINHNAWFTRLERIHAMLSGEAEVPKASRHEYASWIIEAIECGRATSVHGNVTNDGAIENLPGAGCVEVECRISAEGIQPVRFGRIPEQLAALNRAHMAVHELVVEALLERDRQKAKYALIIDPLTAAVCSLEEIDRLFDEMWEAEREFLLPFEA